MKIARKLFGLLLLALAIPDIALAFKPSSEEYGHTMITRTLLSNGGYAFGQEYTVAPFAAQPYVGGRIMFSKEAVDQVVLGAQARDWLGADQVNCDNTFPDGFALCYAVLSGEKILITGDINDENAHFDNDNFSGSTHAIYKLLRSGPDWEDGLYYRSPFGPDVPVTGAGKSVVQLLQEYVAAVSPGAAPLRGDRIALIVARVKLGKALHTLQDFYAHGTWADFYPANEIFLPITDNLGKSASNPDFAAYPYLLAAGRQGSVCQARTESWAAQTWWNNGGNWVITADARRNKIVSTSAWGDGSLSAGADNADGTNARCDHGSDAGNIANLSVSGIAKDAPYMPFAPSCAPNCDLNGKYGSVANAAAHSSLPHKIASYQAARHSAVLLEKLIEVIKSVAYDQTEADRMIAALLGVEEVPHRMALVVDASASMSRIGQGVSAGLGLASSGNGLSLWTYDGNGKLASESDNIPAMQALLSGGGTGGGDCPEPSLAALKQAVNGLPSYSSIALFTDASASDGDALNEVVSAAVARKIKINPVVMGGCGQDASASTLVYQKLASGTGGMVAYELPGYSQALNRTRDMIARFITAKALQARALATLRASSADSGLRAVAPSPDVLLAETGTLPPTRTLLFPVDTGVVQMTVTAAAEGAQVTINNPSGQPVALTDFGNGLVEASVTAPQVGDWTMVLAASAPTQYTARAEVLGGVLFKDLQYESLVEIGARSGHEYRPPLGSTPSLGRSIAKVQLDGVGAAGVTLRYVADGGASIASFPLALVSPGVYSGEVQVPTSAYWVNVTGVDAQGANFSRMWRGEHPLPAPAPGGRVAVQASARAWMPGQSGGAVLALSNLGADEVLTLSARSAFGTVQVSPGVLTLVAGSKGSVELSVSVPASAVVGSSAGVVVTVTGSTGAREIEVPITIQAVPAAGSVVTLTASRAGMGSGSVTSSPSGIDCGADCVESYSNGSVITLTASPQAGSSFVGWSGGCSGAAPTCSVTMDATKTVTATFNYGSVPPGPPTLNSINVGPGSATLNFSAPANTGDSPIASYTATCTASGQATQTATGAGSPLTGGVIYQCTLTATNGGGFTGVASANQPVTPLPAKKSSIVPILMLLLD
ncbi:MAG: hypothetical protein HY777_05040 [Betaproteobacteria bacterium]|nr:hypothetical protein [Betaproteobacteria bacterium]